MKTNTWVNGRVEPIAVKAGAKFLYFNLTNVASASDLADKTISKGRGLDILERMITG